MTTTFIRLLSAQDKAEALTSAVAALRVGRTEDDVVFTVDPSSFSKVPNSPFAYWVDDSIRDLFVKLPPFEGEGRTVKQGLATADDFRFVRAWWEVPGSRRLDAPNGPDHRKDLHAFQQWCRKRTRERKYWVPFAKGGEYSPYYADIHLVVNWKQEGEEIKSFADPKTGKAYSRAQNIEFYFRPGITWPLRSQRGFSARSMPAGGCFGHKGPAGFADEKQNNTLWSFLAIMNSRFFSALLKCQMAFGSYEVGAVQRTPLPKQLSTVGTILNERSRAILGMVRRASISDESMREYAGLDVRDHSANSERQPLYDQLVQETDQAVEALYGATGSGSDWSRFENPVAESGEVEEDNGDSSKTQDRFGPIVGLTFGRWDVRPLLNEKLVARLPDPFSPLPVCPPATLMGPDGLPARSSNIASAEWLAARPDAATLPPAGIVKNPAITDSDYPVEVPWDGILVDDPDHPADIVQRMRKAMEVTWKEKADSVEQEACQALGVGDLRSYMGSPTGFFQDHLARYSKSRRKAPIYWPLSTASGSYTLWIYYPRLTESTLYQCVNTFLKPKLDGVRAEHTALRARMEDKPSAEIRDRFDIVTSLEREIEEMTDELLRVAALGYRPDLDDGVVICACPLRALFRLPRWKAELDETWEKLEKGDFDWAHLAMALWPDRVTTTCARNRSFAIAHDQEALFVAAPGAEPKPARARKGKKS